VLDPERLLAIADGYVGRSLTGEDIRRLRDGLTALYVEAGFITSGAVIPDQDLTDGVLVIELVEGRLQALEVSGAKRFRDAYLRRRIAPDPDEPINTKALEERLQLLQDDPQIETVHAELRPGDRPGGSILRIRIVEARGFTLVADFNNHRSPAIGAENGRLHGTLRNLTGWGDLGQLSGQFSEGLVDLEGRYATPVNRWDTRVGTRIRWSHSEVVEAPFDRLDIESDFFAVGFELTHPLYRDRRNELRVGVLGEWRRGRNYVAGEGFSFSEGADRGVSQVAPLRFHVEWIHRGLRTAVALRGTTSVGLPILGATNVHGAVADARFVTFLAQAQAVHRFERLGGLEAIFRGDAQLSDDALLPIEQFSIGGHSTVRGYRENTAVRDNGWLASLEARIPVLRRPDGSPILQLAPFVDLGRAWDSKERVGSNSQNLASVGTGLRWLPFDWLRAEIYWGHGLIDVDLPEDSDVQDDGLHFRIAGGLF
jgi:hemolysin activation/secretion protein